MKRTCSTIRSSITCLGLCLVAALSASAAESLRARTYESPEGDRYFAASIGPVEAADERPTDVVLLVDTSASQTGPYRDKALAAAEALLDSLGADDRVAVMAADIDTRPLTEGLKSAGDALTREAIEALRDVAPLGSTDLSAAFEAAQQTFGQDTTRAHTVVFIGDGLSTTKLSGDRLRELVSRLRGLRVAVTSYAIGPQRDNALLAALANQTGGNLYIATPIEWADAERGVDEERATQENLSAGARAGRSLGEWAHATVAWPTSTATDGSIAGLSPAELPPLRSDRDSVVLGKAAEGADSVALYARIDGRVIEWSGALESSDDANAYLAQLVEQASKDGGASLTTLGTVGLEETGRSMLAQIDQLTDLAERAASLGDTEGAARISQAVLRRDPGNLRAQTVQFFGEQEPVEPPQEGELNLVRPMEPLLDSAEATVAGDGYVDSGQYPPSEVVVDGRFLDSVDRSGSVYAQLLEKEVQNAIADARDIMAENPEGASQQLKVMLLNVERAPELLASVRAGLIDKLRSALREAARRAEIKDDLDREREARLAAAREQRLLLDRLELRTQRQKQLIDRIDSLVEEGRYREAQEVAMIAEDQNPYGVEPRVAREWTLAKRYHEFNMEMRRDRAAAFIETLAQVEKSAIPFPDDPPIVYPDAQFWAELTERRKQYSSVDLAGKSESEEAISAALTSPLTSAGLDFEDTALEEVVAFLRDEYEIEIQLDTTGLDDLGLDANEPISVNLRNISLRSALRLMLKPLELTYVIDDEVLLITSEDEALNRLSVKVYPVADLVLPIITPQVSGIGGGGGGLGGGGGGGLGGGGGGLGGGGGGFGGGGGLGGGGGGFGGGGGAFSVPDTVANTSGGFRVLNIGPSKPAAQKESASQPEENVSAAATTEDSQPEAPIEAVEESSITLPSEGESVSYWEGFFAKNRPEPSAVREAVRRLLSKRRFDHVSALIESALRHGQPQPWMYESLGIAMQLEGRSDQEVERAVMSAVDFADSPATLLKIADYLTSLDLDRRAVQVCRLAVESDPMLHEAYALALRAAQRSDDADAIRWATTAILSQAWPTEQASIVEVARRASEALLARLETRDTEAAAAYREELAKASVRDCEIIVSWTGDADVDVAVQEPGGTVCSLGAPRTIGGGVLSGDGASTSEGEVHRETYVCPRGFSGDYRLAVRKVWGDVTADIVTVEVKLAVGTPDELSESQQIKLTEGKDSVVEFSLADGRRTDPIEEHQIAQAIERQHAIGRAVLAQQISSLAEDGPTSLRPGDLRRRRRALAQAGQGVGFQPVIITLPDGTNFQATGVVSADRRYVRVTAVPFFSGVSDVTSFTFATSGAQINNTNNTTNNTTNTDVTAGGGGGGGLVGGGGGGNAP